ncbi:FadR/GntR family transcriptional regulator [Thalassiella azotivora]
MSAETTVTDSCGAPAGRQAAPPPGRRAGLIDRVIEQLRSQVLSGTWPVGSRIPTEPELVELTGTGRNTVREAVQALVHAGLLERRQGSGTYVVADSELAVAVGRRVADARHRDVLEVRRTLEVGAAWLAATRRTDEDCRRLESLLALRSERRVAGDTDGMVQADVELHLAIAEAGRNAVLVDLYRDLLGAISENVSFNITHISPLDDDDHVELVRAIVAGDADRAAAEAARFLDEMLESASSE